LKDQITHHPDNAGNSVAKQKFKITNWRNYNKALINRGSLTFWLDEAIQAWYESATPASRGRPQRYSDPAITTVLVIKHVFRLTLRATQGFIDSIFTLMDVPLRCPDYTSVSKRAKSVNVRFKTPSASHPARFMRTRHPSVLMTLMQSTLTLSIFVSRAIFPALQTGSVVGSRER
jgi:hypothetical protein